MIWKNPSHGAKFIFWVVDIRWKFELFSFQNFLLGSLLTPLSKVTVQRPQKIKKNIRVVINYFHFADSPFATCDRFSQIISQLIKSFYKTMIINLLALNDHTCWLSLILHTSLNIISGNYKPYIIINILWISRFRPVC